MSMMKRSEINPMFRKYDSFTYQISDFTKPNKVKIYRASGYDNIENGQIMFEFDYEPLIDSTVYNNLLTEYDSIPVLKELYNLMSFSYFTIYVEGVKWLLENIKIRNGFDFDDQLLQYKLKTVNDFCCPIVKHIDLSLINNTNFYNHLRSIVNFSEINNIQTVSKLLYGTDDFELAVVEKKYSELGKLLLNSIVNIAYNRFRHFFEIQTRSQNHSIEQGKERSNIFQQPKTEAKASEHFPDFKNNFDSVEPAILLSHFKTGLVEKGYLEEKELLEYLKVAFELKIFPPKRFKINEQCKKQKINAVFYNYYSKVAGKPHGKQRQYAALLGEYFDGYSTKNISSNFNKSVTN